MLITSVLIILGTVIIAGVAYKQSGPINWSKAKSIPDQIRNFPLKNSAKTISESTLTSTITEVSLSPTGIVQVTKKPLEVFRLSYSVASEDIRGFPSQDWSLILGKLTAENMVPSAETYL